MITNEYFYEIIENENFFKKQAIDEAIIAARYEKEYPDDKSLSICLENKSDVINIMRKKYAWARIPEGFEYRDNFRFDHENSLIIFDRHKIVRDKDGVFVALDRTGKRFIDSHLQLFDVLEKSQMIIDNVILKCKDEILTNSTEAVTYNDDIMTMLEKLFKVNSKMISSTVKWLNKLNEIDKSIDTLTSEFTNDNNLEFDKLYILNLLPFYHSRGADLEQNYRLHNIELFYPGSGTFSAYKTNLRNVSKVKK